MESEKNLPFTNVQEEMIELLQLSLMLLLRNSVGKTVNIPKQHLENMKKFTVNVKVTDSTVQYSMLPLPQRGSSSPENENI